MPPYDAVLYAMRCDATRQHPAPKIDSGLSRFLTPYFLSLYPRHLKAPQSSMTMAYFFRG